MSQKIFPYLLDEEEGALLSRAQVREFCSGATVLDYDVESRLIHIIHSGSVVVEYYDRGGWMPAAHLGEDEFFGEMSFVDGQRTSARVICETPSKIAVISPRDVEALESEYPGFSKRVYHSVAAILSKRLRITSRRVFIDQQWG
jgi:CRP-like cAMP-binding protein